MGWFSRKTKAVPAADRLPTPPGSSGGVAGRESRIRQLGEDLLARARAHQSGVLSARFYSDKLMDWSMRDPNFKVQLFRFVDAFPVLRDTDDIFEHLKDYLTQPGVKLPPGLDLGLKAGGLAKGLAVAAMSRQITSMASKFIAGTDAASALPNLKALWSDGIAFSVDLLGEACVADREAEVYQRKYLDLVNNLPREVASWAADARLETDHLGPIPRTNVSIKISSLSARCDPIDTPGAIDDLCSRIIPILEAAKSAGVFVNFDMEQSYLKDLTLALFRRCCEAVDFHAGLAMQAYLVSGDEDARAICRWAKSIGRAVTVRLVKGAYWDWEVIHAEQQGWPCPVWRVKRDTDACFERMAAAFIDATPRSRGEGGVKLALGSHNVRSISAALAAIERAGLPPSALELQMLHGMADQLKHAAAEMGLRIREYVPVGQMIPGMAYLVRRLLENTSNESWLKAGFADGVDPSVLLAPPHGPPNEESYDGAEPGTAFFARQSAEVNPPSTSLGAEPGTSYLPRHARGAGAERDGRSAFGHTPPPGSFSTAEKPDLCTVAPERHRLSPSVSGLGNARPFFSEPMRDFSKTPQHEAFAKAVAAATVPNVPNDRSPTDAARMVRDALAAFPAWRDTGGRARAEIVLRAAGLLREQRDMLAGVMIKEAGKTWREADADACEAVDFCEYYARLAVSLFDRTRLGRFIGELDEHWYQPRGVCAVIAPWNFPLAICAGMTVAALVTGNTVVVKPAEQTPGIALLLCELLWKAGVPRSALQFCPAPGETTGAALVRDPRVAIIAFTGSKTVGLDIVRAAAQTPDGQPFVKRVVCEMGGKNAIIVDTSADPDEAILGIRQSAFGFQGQKCSACSRLIVVDPVGPDGPAIRALGERLGAAMRSLTIGDPKRPGTDIGPVIDAEAKAKIMGYIERGRRDGLRHISLDVPSGLEASTGRAFVPPTVFLGVPADHPLATDEIFGPVLAVLHAPDFDVALALANQSPYKLTGGVFSRRPAHISRAKEEFRVGNLYVNRGITGALVGRQPFGGFGMSGIGSKAGGADYLLQFVEPRASCENTLRRGFAPEL